MNTLYYGDNLNILREYIKAETVELIYLDPPFNSNRSYNVLFKDESGVSSDAQIAAFDDSWHWGETAERTYQDLVQNAPMNVAQMLNSMRTSITGSAQGGNQMLAYLVMMAARLVELHRVLKPTGSLYLHCDPTASHYLKILLDMIFGVENFRNEIIWKRSHPKGQAFTRFARNHDVILAYSKNIEMSTWNSIYFSEITDKTLNQYSLTDENGRRYQLTSLLNPNPDRPNLTYSFKGKTKVWRWTRERMEEEDKKGNIIVPKGGEGIPRYKRFLDEQEGIPIDDTWVDIEPALGAERLGYPTQKPLALLERIIQASSNPGDLVLDPFSGCGTCISAAQQLGRQWIGIDITHLAIAAHKNRLKTAFQLEPHRDYRVVGEPEDTEGASQLALDDRFQFEAWAISLVEAQPFYRPTHSEPGQRPIHKGSDRGIDGVIRFQGEAGSLERALVQVKSGKVHRGLVAQLVGDVQREGAQVGIFITLEPPSRDMVSEAASAGFYHSELWQKDYPRVQILTVEELLNGAEVKLPPTPKGAEAFKRAEKDRKAGPKQEGLGI